MHVYDDLPRVLRLLRKDGCYQVQCLEEGAEGHGSWGRDIGSIATSTMAQVRLCATYGSPGEPPPAGSYDGVDPHALRPSVTALYGTRYRESPPSSGWYFTSDATKPATRLVKIHIAHLPRELPAVVPFLFLAPGFYFDTISGVAAFDATLLSE